MGYSYRVDMFSELCMSQLQAKFHLKKFSKSTAGPIVIVEYFTDYVDSA